MLHTRMRTFLQLIMVTLCLALASCSGNNDNSHTTATTVVPPPAQQVLRIETRAGQQVAAQQVPAKPHGPGLNVDPAKPLLVFNLPEGKTLREGEEVVIDFSLANAKLKGDGGEFRVRYIVDDEEMRWIDRWEQVVLTNWLPGKHTIRLELVGPDGWPYRNGDFNVSTRELTITK